MTYTGYELLWLFLAYSFMGWVVETTTAAVRQKKFVNRGLIDGPFCTIYGVAAVLMTIGLHELSGIWLLIGSLIYAAVIEWAAGHLIEKFYHERWWDHSHVRWNLDGYICVPYTLVWGIIGAVCIRWGNRLLTRLFHIFPSVFGKICVWGLILILCADALATYILITGKSGKLDRWEAADNYFANTAARLGKWIANHIARRINRAYQVIEKIEQEEKTGTFAEGCSFYKIAMLFFIGAFLGDLTETIYCRLTGGVWMSRSSVVWGPFSIVWGFAIALATLFLYKYRNRSDKFLFCIGTFLGGAYEYFCSVLSELIFGTVFWDYSEIPFNLGGRINLLYCFFWGIAAVVWLKGLYPFFSRWIEKLPMLAGKILTWALIVFMCCNLAVSALALTRYTQRQQNLAGKEKWQIWMDAHYDDAKIERIYPNMISVE